MGEVLPVYNNSIGTCLCGQSVDALTGPGYIYYIDPPKAELCIAGAKSASIEIYIVLSYESILYRGPENTKIKKGVQVKRKKKGSGGSGSQTAESTQGRVYMCHYCHSSLFGAYTQQKTDFFNTTNDHNTSAPSFSRFLLYDFGPPSDCHQQQQMLCY